MSEGLVLHPASTLVEPGVGQLADMERIGDADRVLEVSGDAAPVALGEVGGHHLDRLEPQPGLARRSIGAGSAALFPSIMSMTLGSSRSTMPVA